MKGITANKKVSVKTVVLILFVAFTALVVLMVGVVFYLNWKSSTDNYINRIADSLSDTIIHEVDLFAEVPIKLNDTHKIYLENDIIDFSDTYTRNLFFYNALNTVKSEAIYSFSYGTVEGFYYGARKNKTDSIEMMVNDHNTNGHSLYYAVNDGFKSYEKVLDAGAFDPRKRDWYKIASDNGGPVFSSIYTHFVMEDLAISSVLPVYEESGLLKGVIGSHVTLGRINDFLREISEPFGGYSYIIEPDGFLVGNSLRIDNYHYKSGEIVRTHINDLNHDIAKLAYETYLNKEAAPGIISDEFGNRHVQIKEYSKYGLDWLIITMVPVDSFLQSSFENILFTFLVTLFAFSLSIFFYVKVTKKYFSPFYHIIEVVEGFANGDYTKRVENITEGEFGKLASSYNHMAEVVSKTVQNLEQEVVKRTLALEENQNRLNSILNTTAEGIVGIGTNGICVFCNQSSLDLLGYKSDQDLIGKEFHTLIHKLEEEDYNHCTLVKAISGHLNVHLHQDVFYKSDGTSFDVEVHLQITESKEGFSGAVLSFTDISERLKSQEEVEYLSKHDSLTGLYNRLYFEETLKAFKYEVDGPISIIMCDVNGLKLTNDIFGHKAGDQLIVAAAEVLKKITLKNGIAARIGGDEFIVILTHVTEVETADYVQQIKVDFTSNDFFAFKGTISVGYAIQKNERSTYEHVIAQAEDMMYMDKAINNKQLKKDAIQGLISKLHALDPYEKVHSENVATLSYELARYINLSKDECIKVKEAGYLHDIGKITLSIKDLEKEVHFFSKNAADHFEHSITGYRILNAFEETFDIAESVLFHHERWDGNGYPRQLKEAEIPLSSRIIAITEAYDELMNHSDELTLDSVAALGKMKELSGIYFDPDLLKTFIEMQGHA